MIAYRSFRNSDPPELVRLWNSQPRSRGRVAPLTSKLLVQNPLARLFFDPAGLIVAEANGRPVGFVHAGLAPDSANGSGSGTSGPADDVAGRAALRETSDPAAAVHFGAAGEGFVWQLVVDSAPASASRFEIASELLRQAESRLRERGARRASIGTPCGGESGSMPLDPFYLGLYGGCRMSGWWSDDAPLVDVALSTGYGVAATTRVYQRELAGFRQPVDRHLIQWRGKAALSQQTDLQPRSWLEACVLGPPSRIKFLASPGGATSRSCEVEFWDMQPLADGWHCRALGLLAHRWDDAAWTDGMAIYLVGEAMKSLLARGVELVELHVAESDTRWAALCRHFGFAQVDTATALVKDV